MKKIASPTDLHAELTQLIAESQDGASRTVLASKLNDLADQLSPKTAAEANLTKMDWLISVVEQQLKEMKHSYGLLKKDAQKYAPQQDNFDQAVRSMFSRLRAFMK